LLAEVRQQIAGVLTIKKSPEENSSELEIQSFDAQEKKTRFLRQKIFFHPDFTVGPGISPSQPQDAARGLYHRSGITPCPEDL
jgi:hypothetical protein